MPSSEPGLTGSAADLPERTRWLPPASSTSLVVRLLGWLLGTVAAAVCGGLLLLGISLAMAYPNLPEIDGLADYRPKLPMRVFSADSVLIGEYGEERRHFTPIAQIPKVMQNAVLAIEDARFYQHSGVDYLGVVRAGLANVGESRSQGASTITMQVARNFYLSTEKTFTRKIYEILLALKIEHALTKEQILEVYMNQIYLGQRAYGFASASEVYFGKPLAEITIAEAAMLAGLPKAPSAYNPIANPRRATQRQLYILDRMVENGFITVAERDAAREQRLRYKPPSDVPVHAEYVAEAARQLVFAQYGDDAYRRGLNVYLTVNAADQEAAYRALRKGVMDYERRQVYRGPESYIDLPGDPHEVDARVAEALVEHPDNDDIKAAVVLDANPRKLVAMLQTGETVTITGDGLKPVASGLVAKGNPKTEIRSGAVIRIVKGPKDTWVATQLPEVEGAFVALDPRSGAIRTMVGGFDHAKSKFNHVTQAWRQPGSSFKPFIYSAALEKGFTPVTVVNDAPLYFDAGTTGSQPWEPKNFDGTYDGPIPLHTALAKSKNMVSIRILQSIGTHYAQKWIARFGFDPEKHPAYLPMALGAGSVTPLQMAAAYSVFANGGYRVNPYLISRLTDAKGTVLAEAHPLPLDETMRAIDARNAFVMDRLLQEVTRPPGTAARAQSTLRRPDVYGKTGTTNDSTDAWFAGFQPTLVAVVWVGYDNPRSLGDKETGGGMSLPIWIDFMSYALKGVPVTELSSPPPGLVLVNGEWLYEEAAQGGSGAAALDADDQKPAQPPNDAERNSILDLFRR